MPRSVLRHGDCLFGTCGRLAASTQPIRVFVLYTCPSLMRKAGSCRSGPQSVSGCWQRTPLGVLDTGLAATPLCANAQSASTNSRESVKDRGVRSAEMRVRTSNFFSSACSIIRRIKIARMGDHASPVPRAEGHQHGLRIQAASRQTDQIMKPHPRIRKTIMWGGAAVTVLLIAIWVATNWWLFSFGLPSGGRLEVTPGQLCVGFFDRRGMPDRPIEFRLERNPGFAHSWSFEELKTAEGWYVWIPIWAPTGFFLLMTCISWGFNILARRRERIARLNLCPACGYSRAGISRDTKCPECGVMTSSDRLAESK